MSSEEPPPRSVGPSPAVPPPRDPPRERSRSPRWREPGSPEYSPREPQSPEYIPSPPPTSPRSRDGEGAAIESDNKSLEQHWLEHQEMISRESWLETQIVNLQRMVEQRDKTIEMLRKQMRDIVGGLHMDIAEHAAAAASTAGASGDTQHSQGDSKGPADEPKEDSKGPADEPAAGGDLKGEDSSSDSDQMGPGEESDVSDEAEADHFGH